MLNEWLFSFFFLLPGYHWDCSDWAHQSQNPLPNITEVPGSEIPDSSSFHSNESNESNNALSSQNDLLLHHHHHGASTAHLAVLEVLGTTTRCF